MISLTIVLYQRDKINLYSQCNPHQNSSWLPCRNWQVHPNIHMEIHGTQIIPTLGEKKKKKRTHISQFQNLPWSYGNHDGVVLAYRSTEQNPESRNWHIQVGSTDVGKKEWGKTLVQFLPYQWSWEQSCDWRCWKLTWFLSKKLWLCFLAFVWEFLSAWWVGCAFTTTCKMRLTVNIAA